MSATQVVVLAVGGVLMSATVEISKKLPPTMLGTCRGLRFTCQLPTVYPHQTREWKTHSLQSLYDTPTMVSTATYVTLSCLSKPH